jgi:hypothetical protein
MTLFSSQPVAFAENFPLAPELQHDRLAVGLEEDFRPLFAHRTPRSTGTVIISLPIQPVRSRQATVSLMKRLTAWDRQSWSALAAPSYPCPAITRRSSALTLIRSPRRARSRCALIRSAAVAMVVSLRRGWCTQNRSQGVNGPRGRGAPGWHRRRRRETAMQGLHARMSGGPEHVVGAGDFPRISGVLWANAACSSATRP